MSIAANFERSTSAFMEMKMIVNTEMGAKITKMGKEKMVTDLGGGLQSTNLS